MQELAAGSMGVGAWGYPVAHWLQRVGVGGKEGREKEATWLSQTELMFSLAGLGIPLRVSAQRQQMS